jgi:MFS transporter, MHS family, proline/betaine transporter
MLGAMMAQAQTIPASRGMTDRTRAVLAAAVGQFFELYDFSIYGFFAVEIGRAFFPSSDPLTSLLGAFATYGVGFLLRPIGAIVIGAYGDRKGRRAALVLTVTLMAAATGLVALVPPYSQIGIWAPIALVLLRLCQGFSTGGEWGGAAAFLVEHAPIGRRGIIGSLHQVATQIGNLTGFLFVAFLSYSLTTDNFQSWGWRIAFIVGALLGPVGYYLRTRTAETPIFKEVEARRAVSTSPLAEALKTHWQTIFAGICICAIAAASTQTFQIYLTQFARQALKLNSTASLLITSASLAFAAVYVAIIGRLSDSIGRKILVLLSCVGFIIFTYPLFALLAAFPTLTTYLFVQFAGAVLYGLVFGVLPTLLAELFPTKVRYTGISISFSIAIMAFGGFTPFINTYLVELTGNSVAPAFWVMAVAALSGIAMLNTKDRTNVAFN